MKAATQASLQALNSFGVEATAGLLLTIDSEEDVLQLPRIDPRRDLVVGGGSNLLLVGNVPGTVVLNRIRGRAVVEEHDDHVLVEIGAGENWHRLVMWSLDQGLSGLENLALIPGLAGAAPIQNIGAYGVELSAVLESVAAWDWQRMTWARLDREQCALAYRDSVFKSVEPARYLITSIRLRLSHVFRPRLDYAELAREFSADDPTSISARAVAGAVIRLRRRKLPDPERLGNAGSFFKNPVVGDDTAESLAGRFPELPVWPAGPGRKKLSAAWMIEHCGLKGHREGQAAVSAQHALVLVNLGRASGRDIAGLAQTVQDRVEQEFGIALEPEPVIVDFGADQPP